MNKQLIAERFTKAMHTYSQEACVQRQIAEKMMQLLTAHLVPPCQQVVEFGCGTGLYSRLLLQHLQPRTLVMNDLCPKMADCCKDLLQEPAVTFLPGDAETLDFPAETQLFTSCSTLQWFEAPDRFFQRCHSLLVPEGYLVFSTFGPDNMKEIRQLTGSGLPYRSLEELQTLLCPHYDLLHSEEEHITLSFHSPLDVLYHLKQTGVTGVSQATHPQGQPLRTRSDLKRFCQRYTETFAQGSTVPLTYHPIYIIAKKKES